MPPIPANQPLPGGVAGKRTGMDKYGQVRTSTDKARQTPNGKAKKESGWEFSAKPRCKISSKESPIQIIVPRVTRFLTYNVYRLRSKIKLRIQKTADPCRSPGRRRPPGKRPTAHSAGRYGWVRIGTDHYEETEAKSAARRLRYFSPRIGGCTDAISVPIRTRQWFFCRAPA